MPLISWESSLLGHSHVQDLAEQEHVLPSAKGWRLQTSFLHGWQAQGEGCDVTEWRELSSGKPHAMRPRNPRHARHVQTSFAKCFKERMIGLSRGVAGMDGKPCRYDEEESCNQVHATCSQVLKVGTKSDPKNARVFQLPLDPCLPVPMPGSKQSYLKDEKKAKLAQKAKKMTCNARMVDMPWGMMNPSASKDEKQFDMMQFAGIYTPIRQVPSMTVWGLAVHGKSGTPWFDSHGVHAADYIYQLPQGNGLPPDYYVCDSRVNPQVCGLIGGNLRHACAEWYDPFACHFCEDHGDSIQCEVRGWNHKLLKWAPVPIYPRDLLGELYRGEFYNTLDRPLYASINIPKAELQHGVKEMPWYMIEQGEAQKAVQAYGLGVSKPPKALNPFAMSAWDPVPIFLPPELRRGSRCGARRSREASVSTPTKRMRPRPRARHLRKPRGPDDFF